MWINVGWQNCAHAMEAPPFDDANFRLFSLVTAGSFFSAFMLQFLQLYEDDVKDSVRSAPGIVIYTC